MQTAFRKLLKYINIQKSPGFRKNYKKAGYYTDQKGIYRRYLREKSNWEAHLNNTKASIISFAQKHKGNQVAILGSGWLLDVPILELMDYYQEIHLWDISHPAIIKNKYKDNNQIKFIEADINGPILQLINHFKTKEEISQFFSQYCHSVSFNSYDSIISVNLLNQLDIIFCDYLKEKYKFTESELINIRHKIQKNHLESLPPNKSLLITDYKELRLNSKQEIVDTKDLVHCSLTNTKELKSWEWKFDTNYQYHTKYNITFKVKSLSI